MCIRYKILQMSVRQLCRQMNACEGSIDKHKLQNGILHLFMFFDLSLLVHLPFTYHLKILLNLIYSFVSLVWTSHKCLLRGDAAIQSLPSLERLRCFITPQTPQSQHQRTHTHVCFCPRDQTQALTREQHCVPAVHPRPAACSHPRSPCWRAACVYYKTALI